MPSGLPSSGVIAVLDLFNAYANGYTMQGYYRGNGKVPNIPQNNAIPTSGTIALDNFYATFPVVTYSTSNDAYNTNFNLSTYLTSVGWDGVQPFNVTYTNNSVLGSTSTGLYAWDTGGVVAPAGSVLTIVNQAGAYITGAGGGGNQTGTAGIAMFIGSTCPVIIYNYGTIQSGGFGGSGGSGGYGGGGAGYYAGAGAGYGTAGSLTGGGNGGYNSGKGTTNGSNGSGPGSTYAILGINYVTFAVTGTITGSTG
jgi:hypothetical protein